VASLSGLKNLSLSLSYSGELNDLQVCAPEMCISGNGKAEGSGVAPGWQLAEKGIRGGLLWRLSTRPLTDLP